MDRSQLDKLLPQLTLLIAAAGKCADLRLMFRDSCVPVELQNWGHEKAIDRARAKEKKLQMLANAIATRSVHNGPSTTCSPSTR